MQGAAIEISEDQKVKFPGGGNLVSQACGAEEDRVLWNFEPQTHPSVPMASWLPSCLLKALDGPSVPRVLPSLSVGSSGDKESQEAGEDLYPGVIEQASRSPGFCGTSSLFSQTLAEMEEGTEIQKL